MTESELLESLRHIESVDELEAALGPLSPGEQRLMEAMSAPVTEEELATFDRDHPGFTERVVALARERHPEWFAVK